MIKLHIYELESARLRQGWNPKYPCSSPFTQPWLEQRKDKLARCTVTCLLFASFPWNEHLCTFACLLTHLTPSPLCSSSQDGLLPRGWWGSGSQKTETEPPGHFASGTNDRKHPFNRLLIPYIDLNEALPISVFCKRSRTQQQGACDRYQGFCSKQPLISVILAESLLKQELQFYWNGL